MNPKKVLDSYGLLAYLNKEIGFEAVKGCLTRAMKANESVLMNEINIGETYYILSRTRGGKAADFFIDTILEGLPISRIQNDFDAVIAAARIKAEYPISFADCFAVQTARRENAVIMTGDPEFKKVEHLVKIQWIE